MSPNGGPNVVVIGGSAGGLDALKRITADLGANFDAAVFVVLHTLPSGKSLLPEILARNDGLRAIAAPDRASIEAGTIYCAPPDHHIVLHKGCMRVIRGPKENRHRPSIDVLFRSAALAYGSKAVSVLLSGSDDDGTAGTGWIKHHGGTAIVQDPEDAAYPRMPETAARLADPDYTLPAAKIGPLLQSLTERRQSKGKQVMAEGANERLGQDEPGPVNDRTLGPPSPYTCPDCNGTLWEVQDGNVLRYQCRVGHAYSAESMLEAQTDSVERALWAAVRALEESASLSRRIAGKTDILRKELTQKAEEREKHAQVIKDLLLNAGS